MEALIEELKNLGEISPSQLKRNHPVLYTKLADYSKKHNVPHVRFLMKIYKLTGSFSTTAICVVCGAQIDLLKKPTKTCSRKCTSLDMHMHRSEDTKRQRSESLRKTNERRKESGETREHALRSFQTRRERYTDEDIHNQYRQSVISTAITLETRRELSQQEMIRRLTKIFKRKSIILLIAIHRRTKHKDYMFRETFRSIFDNLSALGFDFKEQYMNDVYFYACNNGLETIGICKTCGKIFSKSKNDIFCSKECFLHDTKTNPEYRNSARKRMQIIWQDPEYRNKQAILLKTHHESRTSDDRKTWSNKMLETMGEDGRKSRRDNALTTKLERGIISEIRVHAESSSRGPYREYRKTVSRYTVENSKLLEGIELRGKHSFHIDHIFPIQKGFRYNVPPSVIGSLANLRMLEASANRKKSSKIEIIPSVVKPYIMNRESYA